MTTPRTLILALALSGTAAIAAPSVASADFCVGKAGTRCTGQSFGNDLQGALNAAAATPEPDTVFLGGAGSPYAGPFTYLPTNGPGNTVTIEGPTPSQIPGGQVEAGDPAGRPVLTSAGNSSVLRARFATVRSVDFDVPENVTQDGIELTDGELNDVVLTGGGANGATFGIFAAGTSKLDRVRVDMNDIEGSLGVGGNVTATGLSLRGAIAGVTMFGDASRLTLTESRVEAKSAALFQSIGQVDVRRSVLATTGQTAAGVQHQDGNLVLDHVTVASRTRDPAQAALIMGASTRDPSVLLHSVALAGYQAGLVRDAANGHMLNLSVADSVWDPANDLLGGADVGAFTERNNAHIAPALVDRVGGDLRPRFASLQIDLDASSDPVTYGDLDGTPSIDGNGDGTSRPDAGAIEYRRQAPEITAASVPSTATAGTPAQFAAETKDADGDAVAASWSFGDGETASGNTVSHSYGAAGTRTVTVEARDDAGLTATRTFTVAVAAAAGGPGGAPGGAGGGVDRTAPVIRTARLTPAGRVRIGRARTLALALNLSEAATVRVEVRGRAAGRRATLRRTFARKLGAGKRRVPLAAALRRLKVLARGRLVLRITATDAAGNRSRARTLTLTLNR